MFIYFKVCLGLRFGSGKFLIERNIMGGNSKNYSCRSNIWKWEK